jgi:hypothetical protein
VKLGYCDLEQALESLAIRALALVPEVFDQVMAGIPLAPVKEGNRFAQLGVCPPVAIALGAVSWQRLLGWVFGQVVAWCRLGRLRLRGLGQNFFD